jgi:pSer/pThr/pTyr-binding forkhead associated (FHA) protein
VAHLTLLLDNREVRKFVLNRGVTTIGRAQDNDIVINNLALSRRHAQVEFKGGRFEVVDLQSQNGVYVNQERVRGPRPLDDRDSITLGTYQFVFRGSEESEPEVRAVKPGPRARPRVASTEPGDDALRAPQPTETPEVERVPLLVLKYNDVELQRFPIRGESCLVGRAKECDVQIPERRLSRKHCEIRAIGGRYRVNDLGSQNGTYVNRKRIRGTHDLDHGDVLNFAEYSVLFLAEAGSYQGPDAEANNGPRPSPAARITAAPGFEKDETAVPRAYRDDDDEPIRPVDLTDDPDDVPVPVVMNPRGRRAPVEDDHDPLTKSPAEARAKRTGKAPSTPPAAPIPLTSRRSEPAGAVVARRTLPPDEPRGRPSDEPRPRDERGRASDEPRARGEDRGRASEEPRARDDRGRPGDEPRGRPSDEPRARASDEGRARPSDERGREARDGRSTQPPPPQPGRPSAVRVEPARAAEPVRPEPAGKKRPEPARRAATEEEDIADPDAREPDEALDDWYQARHERSEMFDRPVPEEDDEPDSLLPPRGQSSVSQVLSQMMVGKNELANNLQPPKQRKRRFSVDVRHHEKLLYSGPLSEAVTILGTDREADIQLKGRYVAGRHSLLVRVRDSLLLVRLGSSSAARVNGLPKLQAFLKTGDVIQIDETTITITEE